MTFIQPINFVKPLIRVNVEKYTPLLETDDHTSEGFVVKHKNKLIAFFRLEPGVTSNHVGNGGKVVKSESLDNGDSWSSPITLVDNEYDNRNVHGGILKNDRIVVFYRDYNATSGSGGIHIANKLIYSDDGFMTWSEPITLVLGSKAILFGTGKIDYIPELNKYIAPTRGGRYNEIRFSKDGIDWSESVTIGDYPSGEYNLDEVAVAYCGKGRVIAISRDAQSPPQCNYQMISIDYGKTWSAPQRTNIPIPSGRTAPFLHYDADKEIIIFISGDRRSQNGLPMKEESIQIFANYVDNVFDNPTNWKQSFSFQRPKKNSNLRFYGYPTICQINNTDYFAIFTDSDSRTNGNENADLYKFKFSVDLAFMA